MSPSPAPPASPFKTARHNHENCIESAVDRAVAVCAERGVRLTDLRREVLELIWRGHEPIGAYAMLEALRITHPSAAPPTVYRALDFLIEQGLIHRIESLNAYVGCAAPGDVHSGQFLVCEACGDAAEIDDPGVGAAIIAAAAGRGFRVQRPTVEVRGLCKSCQETSR